MLDLNGICFFILLELSAFFLWSVYQKKEAVPGPGGVFADRWTFCFVFCWFVAVRLIAFGAVPGGVNQDEAMAAVDAFALASYGTDRFGTWLPAHLEAWGYGQMSALLSYCMAPFIKLFGLSNLAIRLPALLWSVAGALAVYGLVKDWLGADAAGVTLLFLSVNPWHFMQSRWSLDCNLFPHAFVIGLYFLHQAARKPRSLWLSMVFFALCMYAYGVSFYMVPVFLLLASLLLFVTKRVDLRQIGGCVAVYFGVAWPIYGTMLINFLKTSTISLPFVTLQRFEGTQRTSDMLFFSANIPQQLAANARSLFRTGFLQVPDLPWNALDAFGTVYQCTMPLVLLGIGIAAYWAWRGETADKKTAARLLLLYWACSLLVGLCINGVNVNRLNILFYSHVIFAGLAMHEIIKRQRKTALVFFAVFFLQSTLFFHYYFTTWAGEAERFFYRDFVRAVTFAGDLSCETYYITPDVQFDGSTAVAEILTEYALEIDAHTYQDAAYASKYVYQNRSAEEWDAGQDACYILPSGRLQDAPPDAFSVWYFDRYCVVASAQYHGK